MMRRLKSVPTAERTTEPAGARIAAERSCVMTRDQRTASSLARAMAKQKAVVELIRHSHCPDVLRDADGSSTILSQ
jgi:hypothetical protein